MKKPLVFHLTKDGRKSFCGVVKRYYPDFPNGNFIHVTYANAPLDHGQWCAKCLKIQKARIDFKERLLA